MGGGECQDVLSCPIAIGVIMAVQKVGGGTSGALRRIFRLAPSHLTQKCLCSVAHEFVISGVEVLSSSYHLSVMLPAPRWQASDSHFSSSV